jgi:hypothetical protein
MRVTTFAKLALVGGGVAAVVLVGKHRRARRDVVERSDFDIDPTDPLQAIDEIPALHIEDLSVDALSSSDAEADRDSAVLESDLESTLDSETNVDALADERDAGDLYGVHVPTAVTPTVRDDDTAFSAEGENWLEALEADAAENGADPERELDVIDLDDSEFVHPHTDTRDRPIADRGAGGRRGL